MRKFLPSSNRQLMNECPPLLKQPHVISCLHKFHPYLIHTRKGMWNVLVWVGCGTLLKNHATFDPFYELPEFVNFCCFFAGLKCLSYQIIGMEKRKPFVHMSTEHIAASFSCQKRVFQWLLMLIEKRQKSATPCVKYAEKKSFNEAEQCHLCYV